MHCTGCGRLLHSEARRCDSCGHQVEQRAPTSAVAGRERAGADVAAWRSRALLVFRHDPQATAVVPMSGTIRIGGDDGADLYLEDISVSRSHAEVAAQDDVYVIRDLGSLNGTYVNGCRVDEAVLNAGDEIRIGRFRLTFLIRRPS